MSSSNPYRDMTTEEIVYQTELLKSVMYDSHTMLKVLLHLSSSPDKNIAEKAQVAYNSLLTLKDQAFTSKAYANQQLAQNFDQMCK